MNENNVEDKSGILTQVEEKDAPSVIFLGIVQTPQEKRPNTIKFAKAGDCSRWIEIPGSFIEKIDYTSTIACGDHTHPFVKLFMKRPQSDEGAAFCDLARLYHAIAIEDEARPFFRTASLSLKPQAVAGGIDCYFDWKRGWICQNT